MNAKNTQCRNTLAGMLFAAIGCLTAANARANDIAHLSLPTNSVTYTAFAGADYTAYLHVSGVGAGFDFTNGVHGAWCIDYGDQNLYDNHTYTGYLYNSLSDSLPPSLTYCDYSFINYILNHKQGDRTDVNVAIWYFSDGVNAGINATSQAMISDALVNGCGFVPAPGQIIGVILDGVDEYGTPAQTLIVETPTPECDQNPGPTECDDFVTGGGWIVGTPSGAKANFGVHGGIKKNGLWGGLNYLDHGTGMHVKSTSVTGYFQINSTGRQINYNVTINGQPGSAIVRVYDNGEPGRNDVFDIQLSNGYQAGGDLGGAGPGGGNIQLHKSKCDNSHGGKPNKK